MKIFKIFDKSFDDTFTSRSIIEITNDLLNNDKSSIVVKLQIDETNKRIFEIYKSKF